MVESVTLGLGYSAVLVWIGSAFVGSFGDFDDAHPYWPAIPHLRTDTAGFLAFAIAVVCLVISRYLQLGRRNGAPPEPAARPRPARILAVQLTRLLPWPSEGTVRVIALGVCLAAVATRRYLRATATRPGQPAAVPERAGVAA